MDAPSEPEGLAPPATLRQAARRTSLYGIGFALLFTAGLLLITATPPATASDQQLTAFYASGNRQAVFVAGVYLVPIAAVAFLWFLAALRRWTNLRGRPGDRLLSSVQSFSGIGFITLVFAAAGAVSVVASSISPGSGLVDPVLARQFPLYGRFLLMVFGLRMAAIFVLSTANSGRRAKILPRWFAVASYLVAAALFLTASLNRLLVLVFPLWVVVLCALICLTPADDAASMEITT